MMRGMVAMALILFATPIIAADARGKVEAKLDAQTKYFVGQHIPMTITLFAPAVSFAGVPAFDVPEVSGTFILKLPGSPIIGSETEGDLTYVTQTHEFGIFPQRTGKYSIPAFPVRFGASQGFGKPTIPFTAMTEPLEFTVTLPPGVGPTTNLISTNDLKLEETWTPDSTSAKVGDSFTHTVTFRGADIPGMAIPPLPMDHPHGLAVYPKQPVVADESDRGTLTGVRTDSVVYICQSPGTYHFPARILTWWDLDDRLLRRLALAAHTIQVAEPPPPAESVNDSQPKSTISRYIPFVVITIVGGVLVLLLAVWWWRPQRTISPAAGAWASLESACRIGDERKIYEALRRWLDLQEPRGAFLTVREWSRSLNAPELSTLVDQLENDLYGPALPHKHAPFPAMQMLQYIRRVNARNASPSWKWQLQLEPLNPRSTPSTRGPVRSRRS